LPHPKHRGEPIRRLIDFLRLWYSQDELHQRWGDSRPNAALFQLLPRLMDAAIRYRKTKDRRVYLELPIEERTLLEMIDRMLANPIKLESFEPLTREEIYERP
jgi:hypothetical protein